MSEWERLLLPCPIGSIPKITLQFKPEGDPRQAITSVLSKYKIPWGYFLSHNRILSCRMTFTIFEDGTLLFALDPREDKGLETIEFAIKLLREMGFINDENETKVREKMMRDWDKWVSVFGPALPIFLGILMRDCD
jgi:hypothetical protein